jgi:peptidoglycan hydrolase-like protein with peptidoglycan-binding domain
MVLILVVTHLMRLMVRG